MKVIPQTAR